MMRLNQLYQSEAQGSESVFILVSATTQILSTNLKSQKQLVVGYFT